mmetsp:Transcript_9268/g.29679  ORF Transcript_9268/g.29679 Transcript_9268/m.29679 type:complete len:221 (-) Transcript_9268:199-861(-)
MARAATSGSETWLPPSTTSAIRNPAVSWQVETASTGSADSTRSATPRRAAMTQRGHTPAPSFRTSQGKGRLLGRCLATRRHLFGRSSTACNMPRAPTTTPTLSCRHAGRARPRPFQATAISPSLARGADMARERKAPSARHGAGVRRRRRVSPLASEALWSAPPTTCRQAPLLPRSASSSGLRPGISTVPWCATRATPRAARPLAAPKAPPASRCTASWT